MLRDSIGVSAETTYGTFVAPARHHPLISEDLVPDRQRVKSGGRTDTQLAQQSALVRETVRNGGGPLQFEPTTKGLGVWLNTLHGNTVTPSGAGADKSQVHNIGSSNPSPGKSLSIEVGIEDASLTRRAKRITGAVPESVEFRMNTGGILEQTWTMAAQDVDMVAAAPATTVYPSGAEVFGFADATVKLNAALVADTLVKAATVKIDLPRKKDRFGLNGSALAKYPVLNGKIAISGTLEVEFDGLTQVDAFENTTLRALELKCLGITDIVAGTKASLTIAVPIIRVTKATPTSQNEDLETMQIEWEAEIGASGSHLATLTYVSADTAL